MFFHSAIFLFSFLPVVLAGFLLMEGRLFLRQAWLLGASLVFYAVANPVALVLFLPLVGVNFGIGSRLMGPKGARWLLVVGVVGNLLVLGYFKYANFFVANLNAVLGAHFFLESVLLPLGLSFLIFMQIAWLVACSRREAVPCRLFEFLLYSSFFPQVVAGPIVYQRESLPQFRRVRTREERDVDLCVGATLFTMGLGKKVLIADTLAPWATQVFWAAGAGRPLSLTAAWIGALAYAFQLYFDFSGYSDMAIGTARVFGVKLPLNFDSPYKAVSISEFWRRWHMTLSRFLRDFVYIPLGGSRCSPARRSFNLFFTMVVGGFWHGAGWTFLFWGALHGGYLVVNHWWSSLCERRNVPGSWIFPGWGGGIVTFLAVLVAWVFFRAANPGDAMRLLGSMVGGGEWHRAADPIFRKSSPELLAAVHQWVGSVDIQLVQGIALGLVAVFVWWLPNSQQVLAAYEPGLVTYGKSIRPAGRGWPTWKPSFIWLAATVVVFAWCLLNLSGVSSFLYRDF